MQNNVSRLFLFPILFLVICFTIAYAVLYYIIPDAYFFPTQLFLSKILVFTIAGQIIVTIFLKFQIVKKHIITFFFEPVSPYSLAIFRIGFFTLINGMYWYQYQNVGIIKMPNYSIIPLPFSQWYLQWLPFNYAFYKYVYYIGTIVAIFSALGLGYRYLAWLNIVFSFYLIGLPMFLGKLFYMQLWFWGSCFLAFSPASDTLSIDAFSKKLFKKKIEIVSHYKYGIALKWLWLHLGIIYFFSAIYKLLHTGLSWALGSNMINQMQIEWLTNYYEIPSFRIDNFPLLAKGGGVYIIIIELLFIFFLFSKKTRWFALLGGLSMHWGATYFLNLSMGDMQFMYLSIASVLVLSKKRESNIIIDIKANYFNAPMIIGIVFFTVNSIFGFFNISSWPFSSYPSHSSNIQNTFTRVEFEIQKNGLKRTDIDSIGKKNGFRKDNYYSISDDIIQAKLKGDTLAINDNIKLLWNNWRLNNPELRNVVKPEVYIIETPIDPEKKNIIIRKEKIDF